jgi:DnaJ-class molecular chaperone
MAADPYQVLGVERDAAQDEVSAAYRKLAKQLHPDLNPGNKQAEEQFKAVSTAYALLSDPEKRARVDRGEIDAMGAERPSRRYYRDFHEPETQAHSYSTNAGFADFEDILSSMFGGRSGYGAQIRVPGEDIPYRLSIDFLEAVNGTTKRITLADGSTLALTIPAGTRDGQVLRLRGKGKTGAAGGPSGDALVTISVRPHPFFMRKGDDVEIEVPITLREAVLGGTVEVPTPAGRVRLKLPEGANTGTRLRLKGKGVPRADGSRGDAYATLRIFLPEESDPELEEFVQRWQGGKDHNPRRHLEDTA